MKITHDTPDLLILRFTRWKASLLWGLATLLCLWAGKVIVDNPNQGWGTLIIWLCLTVVWFLPLALLTVEKSMLVLNATTGEADFRHRTVFGLHRHTWPLSEVQSTRVTRHSKRGTAEDDPKRILTLYVREGMDEGRHKMANHTMPAQDVLTASARVSDWMKDWRNRVDSHPAEP